MLQLFLRIIMAAFSDYDEELTQTVSSMRDDRDADKLHDLGYEQELKRSFGLLSMVGFGFSILNCWCALAGSLAEIMLNGGPATLTFGWIGTCVFSLCVVVCLAELTSAYPVAGGQYSWCLMLGRGARWSRILSYSCGWIQLSGLLGMVAVGWYQMGINISAMVAINVPNFVPENYIVALIGYGSGIFALLVDIFLNSVLHYISAAALWWSLGGFLTCMITILACAPSFQSPSFVFTSTDNASGWNSTGMSVVLGLMQCAFGMCAYDSVAHMSEEIDDASKQAPRAMVLSVIVGFITGFAFILSLLFVIQDMDAVVNTPTGFPLLAIFYQATGNSRAGAICLTLITVITQSFTNISLLSEGSRSVYAFARDGAFPPILNKYLGKVSKKLEVPVFGLLFSAIVATVLVAILFGSDTAFFTVLSIACTGLYVSYLIPVLVAFFKRDAKAPGYYNLGKWAVWIQVPAIAFLIFCSVFMFFPTELPVTASNMNYCCVAFGIVGLLAVLSWYGGARHSYIRQVSTIAGEVMVTEGEAVSMKSANDSYELKKIPTTKVNSNPISRSSGTSPSFSPSFYDRYAQ